MKPLRLFVLLLAAVLFLLVGLGVQHPRFNLIAWGLFLVTVAEILPAAGV